MISDGLYGPMGCCACPLRHFPVGVLEDRGARPALPGGSARLFWDTVTIGERNCCKMLYCLWN